MARAPKPKGVPVAIMVAIGKPKPGADMPVDNGRARTRRNMGGTIRRDGGGQVVDPNSDDAFGQAQKAWAAQQQAAAKPAAPAPAAATQASQQGVAAPISVSTQVPPSALGQAVASQMQGLAAQAAPAGMSPGNNGNPSLLAQYQNVLDNPTPLPAGGTYRALGYPDGATPDNAKALNIDPSDPTAGPQVARYWAAHPEARPGWFKYSDAGGDGPGLDTGAAIVSNPRDTGAYGSAGPQPPYPGLRRGGRMRRDDGGAIPPRPQGAMETSPAALLGEWQDQTPRPLPPHPVSRPAGPIGGVRSRSGGVMRRDDGGNIDFRTDIDNADLGAAGTGNPYDTDSYVPGARPINPGYNDDFGPDAGKPAAGARGVDPYTQDAFTQAAGRYRGPGPSTAGTPLDTSGYPNQPDQGGPTTAPSPGPDLPGFTPSNQSPVGFLPDNPGAPPAGAPTPVGPANGQSQSGGSTPVGQPAPTGVGPGPLGNAAPGQQGATLYDAFGNPIPQGPVDPNSATAVDMSGQGFMARGGAIRRARGGKIVEGSPEDIRRDKAEMKRHPGMTKAEFEGSRFDDDDQVIRRNDGGQTAYAGNREGAGRRAASDFEAITRGASGQSTDEYGDDVILGRGRQGGIRRADGGHWVAEAFDKHPGKLHRALHVSPDEPIPAKKLTKAAHSANPTLRREAALAETAKGFKRR